MFQYQYVNLRPSEQIGVHEQPSWELSYIIKGKGTRVIGNVSEPFEAGEIVLVAPHTPHCWHFEGNRKIANVAIFFDDAFLSSCANAFAEFDPIVARIRAIGSSAVMQDGEKSTSMARIIKSMRHEDEAMRITSMLRLLHLIANGNDYAIIKYKAIDATKERMECIKSYVACNIQRDISLADIADHVGMSRAAFCCFFKRTIGITFVAYLNTIRIEQACRLLLHGKMSIAEVCYHSGFNDVPYFNRLFKKTMGMTPKEYKGQ